MVRIAERSLAGQLTAAQPARDRLYHAELKRLAGFEWWQNSRKPRREHRLACPWGADHQQVMAPRRRDLERALGALLSFHVPKVEPCRPRSGETRLRWRQELGPFDVVNNGQQIRRGDNFDLARPGCLATARRGR